KSKAPAADTSGSNVEDMSDPASVSVIQRRVDGGGALMYYLAPKMSSPKYDFQLMLDRLNDTIPVPLVATLDRTVDDAVHLVAGRRSGATSRKQQKPTAKSEGKRGKSKMEIVYEGGAV